MPKVTYFHEATLEDVPEGQTLLDVSIRHRIPHLHQCGGRARCTTPDALQLGPSVEVSLKGKATGVLLYPCLGFAEPDTIFLVQSSFDHILPRALEFGERFYANLFEAHPDLRSLFRNDLAAQTKMLISILSSAVKGLNRMQEIAGGLRALGKRHPDYGVSRADYDKVASAQIRTLDEFLADEFTPELHHAWMTVYGMIAETMIEAAEE